MIYIIAITSSQFIFLSTKHYLGLEDSEHWILVLLRHFNFKNTAGLLCLAQ